MEAVTREERRKFPHPVIDCTHTYSKRGTAPAVGTDRQALSGYSAVYSTQDLLLLSRPERHVTRACPVQASMPSSTRGRGPADDLRGQLADAGLLDEPDIDNNMGIKHTKQPWPPFAMERSERCPPRCQRS